MCIHLGRIAGVFHSLARGVYLKAKSLYLKVSGEDVAYIRLLYFEPLAGGRTLHLGAWNN
jgi:hypothetical protein